MKIRRYYSHLLTVGRVNNPSLTEAARDYDRAFDAIRGGFGD